MKKNLFFVFALALGALVSLPSCGTDDPCKDVECGTNGTCFEGECVCNEGFEGTGCTDEWSAKFTGNYTGKDVCSIHEGGNVTIDTFELSTFFTMTRKSESIVTINNLGGFNDATFDATISRVNETDATATKIAFDFTETLAKKRHFVGTATLENGVLTGSYKVEYGTTNGDYDECTFKYTKQ